MRKLRPRKGAIKLAVQVKDQLSEKLGKPVQVILYGSQARGDATKESDVDLLIVLPSITPTTRRVVSDTAWEVGLDAGKVVSTIPTTRDEMKYYAILPFYKNVKRDGIAV